MKIGYVGLGKLGSVCSAVLQKHGHEVRGYDPYVMKSQIPDYEADTEDLQPVVVEPTLYRLVDWADLIFVAVQTPHPPQYGGENPVPEERRDFEYGYLVQACRDIFSRVRKHTTVVIVSTVLPGTVNRLIRPMKPSLVNLVYSPHFIAMGTTVHDYEHPEFFLMGVDNHEDAEPLRAVYEKVNYDAPHVITSIENAELIKVAYNTFISMKIVWANTLMEMSHKLGTDSDVVVKALSIATDRIISPKYLKGGVGDAGACHPRDLIALSYLAQKLDLSVDLMGFLSEARDKQSEWIVELSQQWSEQTGLPVVLLGKAYKPEVSLTSGSIGMLMRAQFAEKGYSEPAIVDPYIPTNPLKNEWSEIRKDPAVFVVVTKHLKFQQIGFPRGSVVLDPHGYIMSSNGVTVVRVGRK